MTKRLRLTRGAASPIRGRPVGSLVRVIPVVTAQVSGGAAFFPLDMAPRKGPARMTPRVLVVDDDPLYAEAATAILSQDDRLDVVGRASDGRKAVELALSLRPDVVLMDIEMPVMDGIEATRNLGRLLPSARVVVVTSSMSTADRRSARGASAG